MKKWTPPFTSCNVQVYASGSLFDYRSPCIRPGLGWSLRAPLAEAASPKHRGQALSGAFFLAFFVLGRRPFKLNQPKNNGPFCIFVWEGVPWSSTKKEYDAILFFSAGDWASESGSQSELPPVGCFLLSILFWVLGSFFPFGGVQPPHAYTEREREREREMYLYIDICISCGELT